MVVYCTVCMNNTRKQKDISYFNYPKESTTRHEWLKAVGREDLVLKIIDDKTRQMYRICEVHFEKSNIKFSKNGTKKFLQVNAFPTVNLPSNDGANWSQCPRYEGLSGSGVGGAAAEDMMYYEDDLDNYICIDHSNDDATIRCSSCQDYIRGFRYICVQCPDFVTCGSCESQTAHPEHYVLRVPGARADDEVQAVLKEIRLKLFPEMKAVSEDSDDDDEIKIEIKQEAAEDEDEEHPYCVPLVSDDPLAPESKLIDRMSSDVAQVPHVPVDLNFSEISSLVIKEEPNSRIDRIYMAQWDKASAKDSEMLRWGATEQSQSNVVTASSTYRLPNKTSSTEVSRENISTVTSISRNSNKRDSLGVFRDDASAVSSTYENPNKRDSTGASRNNVSTVRSTLKNPIKRDSAGLSQDDVSSVSSTSKNPNKRHSAGVRRDNVSTVSSTSRNSNQRNSEIFSGPSGGISRSTATTSTVTSGVASTSGVGLNKPSAVCRRLGGEAGKPYDVPVLPDTKEHVPFKIKRETSQPDIEKSGSTGD